MERAAPGESPLDFITKNLRNGQPPTNEVVARVISKVEQEHTSQQPATPPVETKPEVPASNTGEISYDLDPSGEAKDGSESKTSEKTDGEPQGEAVTDPDLPVAENFKKLRTKAAEATKTLKQVQEDKSKLEEELSKLKTDIETGAVLPNVVQEKENEIARLSRFEHLHNLKFSKEYQENFTKPLNEIHGKLSEIARDYEVPLEVVQKALNIEKRSELNEYLGRHFDDVGALEIKQLVGEARGLQAKAREAEGEPIKALETLREEGRRFAEVRDQERRTSIADTSKKSWTNAVLKIRAEGKAEELIHRQGDSAHNQNVVTPLLTAASVEFGKTITALARAGLERLDPEVAEALARAHLYGVTGAVAIHTRNEVLRQNEELKKNTQRQNGFMRPMAGAAGSSAPSASAQPPGPISIKEASDALINHALQTGRK